MDNALEASDNALETSDKVLEISDNALETWDNNALETSAPLYLCAVK